VSALPPGWTRAPLEALVTILDSARIPLNAVEREKRIAGKPPESLFPYYGATGQAGVIDGFLFDQPLILLGEDGVPFLDRLRPKAYLVDGKCWVNNHAHVLQALDDVGDRRFLASFLNAFDYQGLVTGSTRLKLTQEAMRSIHVPLAPLPEQKRIADKLDALLARADACRQRLDRVLAILKRFRESVLVAATSGELTGEWREERRYPGEWRTTSLGDVLRDVRYGTAKKCSYEPRATPVLRIPNVASGTVSHEDLKYAEFDDGERRKLELSPGDILMIRSNGSLGLVGRTAVVSEREAGFLYAGYLIRLRPEPVLARAPYLALYLESPESRSTIEQMARSTTGVNNINAEEIRRLPIRIPSLTEQDEIVRRTTVLLELARVEGRLSQAAARLERAVPAALAKAFRGELVPQDPNDEPASALLDRIRAESASNRAPGSHLAVGARHARARSAPEARRSWPVKKRRAAR
jgi:type I restriction enzyme S subunit